MNQILNELELPRFISMAQTILNRAGWEEVGAGYFSRVYGRPDRDYVLKLFNVSDDGYREFLDLIAQHPNPHFPKIKGKPMKVSDVYSAVRMEKLTPARGIPILELYLMGKSNPKGMKYRFNQAEVDKVEQYLDQNPEMKDALDLIHVHLMPKYSQDLHVDNIMKRADGTLVLIDPVSFSN